MKSRIIKDYLAYLWLSFFHCSCDGVVVGNRLDARKSKGRMSVGSGMGVGVGNRLDARERKGRRCVRSGMR